MRIDAYTHFFPAKYFQALVDSKVPDIGKRVREVPAIHDLEVRRKVVSSFPDYKQIICVALPPIGTWAAPDKAEGIARIANDGLKELCDKYPDQFAGFHDLEIRRKVVDSFPDYKQIICVALPPIGTWAAPDKAEGIARR